MIPLILGCGGMLGSAVKNVFPNAIYTDIYTESWLEYLDVRDFNACDKFIRRSDVVINLAAITDMELCERDKKLCFDTNYLGAENVSVLCQEHDKELVYISTAGIFSSDDKECFSDMDTPYPLSNYAKSKYQGELSSLSHPKSYVIRAGWMFGGGWEKDKKFVMKLLKQIKSGQKELYIVNDKKGTPTYTVDFARGIRNILQSKKYGVYNQVCEGFTDRLETAREIVRILGTDVAIKEVGSDYFSKEYYAERPNNESLKNSEGVVMRHWKKCLKEYLDEVWSL